MFYCRLLLSPAILISRLLLWMRCMYGAFAFVWTSTKNEWNAHNTIIIWSCTFGHSITHNLIMSCFVFWKLKTQSKALEQKSFDLQSLSPTLCNLWLLLVYSLLVHVHFIHYRYLLTIFNHPDRTPGGHRVVMIQLKNSLNSWRACCLLRLIICGPVFV